MFSDNEIPQRDIRHPTSSQRAIMTCERKRKTNELEAKEEEAEEAEEAKRKMEPFNAWLVAHKYSIVAMIGCAPLTRETRNRSLS